jgi:coenzyme F420-reducing hydrogenase delta subunit
MFGIEKERVWFRFISASEGKLFASTVEEMVETLKKLGPNPMKKQWEI